MINAFEDAKKEVAPKLKKELANQVLRRGTGFTFNEVISVPQGSSVPPTHACARRLLTCAACALHARR